YYNSEHTAVRRGVRALDDFAGTGPSSQYGSYGRNAYLWDVE
ncbi:MAG: hypothetical protein HW416_3584, partial [Chloroflexi bacterium]|nr:hypothetical protein [Chloroflexota bacterium]